MAQSSDQATSISLRDWEEKRKARLQRFEELKQKRRLLFPKTQESIEGKTTETRKKKLDPNTFQSDHPTLTYLGQYLSFTNTPPPPPAGPIMTAALGFPPDFRFIHYEHIIGAVEKLGAYRDEVIAERKRIAKEEAEQEEWEQEQADLAYERMVAGAKKRKKALMKIRATRDGTFLPFNVQKMTIDDAVDRCWEYLDQALAMHGKDIFMQFPYEARPDYVERMKMMHKDVGEPLRRYREEIRQKITEWCENDDPYMEKENRQVAEGGRKWLCETARAWREDRMVYHWTGLPIWKRMARPPRILARKTVDRQVGKCYQCAAAEDDAICTRREGLQRDCGRCVRLGLHCLVPSTQYTYESHSWHYGEFGEGNTDPLPRYAVIPRNEMYNRLPAEEDVAARKKLRGFLDRVKEEERRLRREKRERSKKVEWVGGERGFVVRDERKHGWALPRAEFKDGRFVGFDKNESGFVVGSTAVKKKDVVKGRGAQKNDVSNGEGAYRGGNGLQTAKNVTGDEERREVNRRSVEQEDMGETFDEALDDLDDSDEFEDAQEEPSRSLEDELKMANEK